MTTVVPPATDASTPPDATSGPEGTDGGHGGSRRGTRRDLLPAPVELGSAVRRWHRIVLAVLMLLGFARGTYWAVTTTVFNPVDELQHFAYVDALATGHGIPTVGQDLVPDELMAINKASPTSNYRSEPYKPDNTDVYWGGSRYSYEAIHGPTYYALMVPFYWAGKPFGILGALYGVRLGSVLIGLAVIPCTWFLARRLFPDRPSVWLLAPGLIAVMSSLFPGAVSNDILAVVLAGASAVWFVRALARPDRWRDAAIAGLVFGLTMVTKVTSMVLIPFLGLFFLAWLAVARPRFVLAIRWAVVWGVTAVAVQVPWFAWNFVTYHAPTAAAASEKITGATMGRSTFGLEALRVHWDIVFPGIWLNPMSLDAPYVRLWGVALTAALLLGIAAAAWKRRWRDLAVLAWCGSAIPLAFATIEAITFILFGGSGYPVGRHLETALPPATVMIAGAAVLLVGARFAPIGVAWIIAASLTLEARVARHEVTNFYLAAVTDDGLGPVITQDWSDVVHIEPPAFRVDAGCPVEAVAVGIANPSPPAQITLTGTDGPVTATNIGERTNLQVFRAEHPVSGTFDVTLPPGAFLQATAQDRVPNVNFSTIVGDPVVRVYCRVPDANQRSFDSLYPLHHPPLSLTVLLATPLAFAGAGVLGAVGVTVLTLRKRHQPDAN